MRKITIIRGLPGSGKSTLARQIAAKTGAFLLDLDSLMVAGGEYHWSPAAFRESFLESLAMVRACARRGCDCVYSESLPDAASIADILAAYEDSSPFASEVIALEIPPGKSFARNCHAVPLSEIERMERAWEPWPGEERRPAPGTKGDWQ